MYSTYRKENPGKKRQNQKKVDITSYFGWFGFSYPKIRKKP